MTPEWDLDRLRKLLSADSKEPTRLTDEDRALLSGAIDELSDLRKLAELVVQKVLLPPKCCNLDCNGTVAIKAALKGAGYESRRVEASRV